ncbi:integrin alpha-PS1-like isoform X3 [Biomphalaria glabrata]|uniref:Integrin alpha-PS1-like isoform X3 n=1 Tax=Biomphalaria glabrata TaxID=6526 RepID=A0A9W3ALR2_BIOGL|nr:integrin alpha-PS1-like isoform X3 [Biomphalaria glabrata]
MVDLVYNLISFLRAFYLIVIYMCCIFNGINGINLDTRFSVLKEGTKGSYFGFSVAQHKITEDLNNLENNLLLVGAPKDNLTSTGGSVFHCKAKSQSKNDCSLISDIDPKSPAKDQWLGVTLASSGPGKKVVGCAHRFMKDNAAVGLCVVLDKNLGYDSMFKPCEKNKIDSYMEDFGLCQAGMSAAVGQDDALVMGAPGSIYWRGTIFSANITDVFGVSPKESVSPYKLNQQDPLNMPPTEIYSYNGYAVAMGRFDNTRALYYVSGAPRSEITGKVVFFRDYKKDDMLEYKPNQILRGHWDFSGFGSSLLAVDINNDSFDDLIVGAPYLYSKNVGGAIYIYYGGRTMINNTTKPLEIRSRPMSDLECQQLMCEHAKFGLSLTKLGDINMDGFQDFAVGAPYEGNGAVYIYHGSSSPIEKYVQKIDALDLPDSKLVSFGYSLSGGMDLDGNGYPDLLVGAYESDTVALIRSRPIIKIEPVISVTPKSINMDVQNITCAAKPDLKNKLCVVLELCLSFTTNPPLRIDPEVTYRLEAEPLRRLSRVELDGAQDPSKRIIDNKSVTLKPTACVQQVAILKDQFDDRLSPIEFKFIFGLATDKLKADDYPKSAVQDINSFPVLDTENSDNKTNSISVEAEFVMECGDDNKCHSNLQFEADLRDLTLNSAGVYEMVVSENNQLQIAIRITNVGEPAYLTRVFVMKPKSLSYFGTQSEDSVSCQTIKDNDTLIMCDQIGNPLKQNTVYFVLKLNVPSSLSISGEINTIHAWINTSSAEETPNNDHQELRFQVINKADLIVDANVAPDNAILCKGEPRDVREIIDESGIGASVKHNFVVRNMGPGEISESEITISWPYELGGAQAGKKKYLLYLMKEPTVEGDNVMCNDIKRYVNPEKIKPLKFGEISNSVKEEKDVQKRRKRQAEPKAKSSGKVVVLSCHESDSVKCIQFKCTLGKLRANLDFVKITFDARLWESTLLSDYIAAPDVQIISWANATIPSRLKIKQDKTNDARRAITRAVPNFKEALGQTVQWWIILVAVLVGLVVLLIVVFVLFKSCSRNLPKDDGDGSVTLDGSGQDLSLELSMSPKDGTPV